MKTKFILIGVLFAELSVFGELNLFPSKTEITSHFKEKDTFRSVNGKIYNVINSTAWQPVYGSVYETHDGILLLKVANGGWSATEGVVDKYTAIKNYPGNPLADQWIIAVAIRVGNYDMDGTPIALYDYGKPYIPPPPTPAQIKAEEEAAKIAAQHEKQKQFLIESNTVVWLQSQVTNGDAEAECSLGEHYLTGAGCETNRTKAVYWLTQSANQGDLEASNKLFEIQKTQ